MRSLDFALLWLKKRKSPPHAWEVFWSFPERGDILRLLGESFWKEVEKWHRGGSFDWCSEKLGVFRVFVFPQDSSLLLFFVNFSLFPFATLIREDPEDVFYRVRLFPEYHLEYVSPSIFRVTGYTSEEHMRRPELIYEVIHPEDRRYLAECDVVRRYFGKPVEVRVIRKDGTVIITERVNVPVFDEKGNLVAIEGIARDITARKELEKKLVRERARFEELLKSMFHAFAVHEPVFDAAGRFVDFRILYVNRAYEQIVGIKAEDALGKTGRELWPGTEEEWFGYFAEVVRTGKPKAFELYHAPTGKYYRCSVWKPFPESLEYCVVFDDVTRERRAFEREVYLKNMLLAIRSVNQIIAEEEDPHQLVEKACRALVSTMSIHNAWIALFEGTAGEWYIAGCGENVSEDLRNLQRLGSFPPCIASVSREPRVLIVTPEEDCPACPFALKYSGRSGIVLPISASGTLFGVLVASLPRQYAADREVQGLFQEVASDLGMAFHRMVTKRAFQEVEERYRLLAENMPGVVYLCHNDALWTMVYLNDRIKDLTGYSKENFLEGRIAYANIVNPDDLPALRTAIERALQEKQPFHAVYRIRRKSGEEIWVEEWGTGVFSGWGEVRYLEGFIQDVTEKKLVEERIRYLATHDPLTGLLSRAFLEEVLSKENLLFPVGVALFDLNGLRLVNDAFGTAMGDQILVHLAEVLQEEYRQGGTFLFRYGGDEFLVLLPGSSEEHLEKSVRRILARTEREKVAGLPLSVSVGFALWRSRHVPFEKVVAEADDHLRRKKLTEEQSAHSALLSTIEHMLRETTQETEEHALRMATLAYELGEAMGLRERELGDLVLLARLHDIGKIAIPRSLLLKPSALSSEEWEEIKQHPEIGYRIAMTIPELRPIALAILTHHERFDGTGYPQGLRGEEIPLFSRILAVVDAYDVMITGRPYKSAVTPGEAIAELKRCAGTQFDPAIVEVFRKIVEERGR